MRMWMVDPRLMCDQHLLGEHVETHMLVGAILKGKSLGGYINGRLVETYNIKQRHDDLAQEMLARNMKHKSPLPHHEVKPEGLVCRRISFNELMARCKECRQRLAEKGL